MVSAPFSKVDGAMTFQITGMDRNVDSFICVELPLLRSQTEVNNVWDSETKEKASTE